MTPPIEDPVAATPTATLIFVEKYWLRILTLGTNSNPVPTPIHIACARNTCQYVPQRLNII